MIVIRLSRYGRLNAPFYRVVAANKRSKREAMPVEVIGTYNPKDKKLDINKDLLKGWIAKGAQLSKGVSSLLSTQEKS